MYFQFAAKSLYVARVTSEVNLMFVYFGETCTFLPMFLSQIMGSHSHLIKYIALPYSESMGCDVYRNPYSESMGCDVMQMCMVF